MSNETERPQLQGAWCVITYTDESFPFHHVEPEPLHATPDYGVPVRTVYCSFGRYAYGEESAVDADREEFVDEFGVRDDEIFYYFEGGLDELEEALDSESGLFFTVLEYELVRVGGDNAPNA